MAGGGGAGRARAGRPRGQGGRGCGRAARPADGDAGGHHRRRRLPGRRSAGAPVAGRAPRDPPVAGDPARAHRLRRGGGRRMAGLRGRALGPARSRPGPRERLRGAARARRADAGRPRHQPSPDRSRARVDAPVPPRARGHLDGCRPRRERRRGRILGALPRGGDGGHVRVRGDRAPPPRRRAPAARRGRGRAARRARDLAGHAAALLHDRQSGHGARRVRVRGHRVRRGLAAPARSGGRVRARVGAPRAARRPDDAGEAPGRGPARAARGGPSAAISCPPSSP